MTRADGEACPFFSSLIHLRSTIARARTRVAEEATNNARATRAVSPWVETALDDGSFFLPQSAFPFISPSTTTSPIHL